MKIIIDISESAYKEMCGHGTDRVDYDISEMIKNGIIIDRNLCDTCGNIGCILQSGIIRRKCEFYMEDKDADRN